MSRSIHRLAAVDLAETARFYRTEAGVGLARRFLAESNEWPDCLRSTLGSGRGYPMVAKFIR